MTNTSFESFCRTAILCILLGFVISPAWAQQLPLAAPSLQPGWERISIKGMGSLDLPPTMEIQKGIYKEFSDEYNRTNGYNASPLVLQQKGLNDQTSSGFSKYARIIIETTLGNPNDYERLNFSVSSISQAEINELSSLFYQEIKLGFTGSPIKLIEWYPVKIEKINGMSCIHISYTRQVEQNPYVFVHIYKFHNYDRIHSLTMSYRITESDYWKSDFATVLKSFRITNIR